MDQTREKFIMWQQSRLGQKLWQAAFLMGF
jgi:hypothetical protein